MIIKKPEAVRGKVLLDLLHESGIIELMSKSDSQSRLLIYQPFCRTVLTYDVRPIYLYDTLSGSR